MLTAIKQPKKVVEPLGYRIDQFCTAFQLSRPKVYAMMKAGELPFIVVGGRRFITAATVERLLQPAE